MPGHPLTRRHFMVGTGAATAALTMGSGGTANAVTTGDTATPHNVPTTAANEPRRPVLKSFPLRSVTLLDSPFRANMRRTCAYLLDVDADRLLHTFRLNVGLPSTADPCGGWEAPTVQLRGHTTGHLLSGLALAHANTGDEAYAAKARRIVAVLAECQAASPAAGFSPGYLSAFPEQVFDQLESGGRPWAPYYTIHKIMAGLLDCHELTGDAQALDVLRAMAAWADRRTAALPYDTMQSVLKVEFGGMNDVLARLHLATGDPTALRAARRFDHEELYGPLSEGRDELAGRHANTEIAKIVGTVHTYEATGDERYLRIASHFWHTVVRDHSYAIGGNSNQELFGPPGEIVSRLSEDTCENCNSYNMLKLGRQLFLHDPGTAAYMDHYEWTLLNQMLAEQDPDSAHGYVTYYTGLWAGSQRQPKGGLGAAPGSYSSDYDNFSCDHGTALETQTKFADTIYAHREDTLYVNLFIPSQVTWTQRGVTLRQDTRYPDAERVRLTVVHGGGRFVLKVRIPGWLGEGGHGRRAVVTVAGQEARAEARPGSYLTLDRHWRTGDTVDITLPMDLTWRPAPDNPHVKALSYGPVVLAGAHGTAQSATIPAIEPASVRKSASVRGEFTARAEGVQVSLLPFHRVHHQHYNVYFAAPPRPRTAREVARYLLDEGSGTDTADSTGTFPAASLAKGAHWATGRGAVDLDGVDGHIVLPPGLITGLSELTVSAWVRVDTLANSARVFDLGYHKSTYFYLTPRTGSGRARAALKIAGMEGEDVIDGSAALPQGIWTHVAVTLTGGAEGRTGGGTGVLYVDGAEAGRNSALVSSPLLLGATTRNYLGRSQNVTHPYLHGAVDDFRLVNRVLSAADVAALARAGA
ncbi:beta-L-arabinofuranosidase domain-containing protein [Streptomyces sp. NBC_01217]|uniref:beta-L-arabinofuranosidase domain-containing protein n=1 Tax=Streptomyces sp. NBC_01217 TaxID=2903779 RepID=UPI002E14BE8E|nr:glycoside hydrolase family 127 protein [Streptomyces sp. NBC_01217]